MTEDLQKKMTALALKSESQTQALAKTQQKTADDLKQEFSHLDVNSDSQMQLMAKSREESRGDCARLERIAEDIKLGMERQKVAEGTTEPAESTGLSASVEGLLQTAKVDHKELSLLTTIVRDLVILGKCQDG